MTMRPTWWLSLRPMFVQLLPPSDHLPPPSAHEAEFRALASPVPTQTICGFDGATATSPMHWVLCWSNTGVQVRPSLVVFHSPPLAAATYIVFGSLSTT